MDTPIFIKLFKKCQDLFCFGPQCFYDPQLQITCCYIARYCVRKKQVRLGVIKDLC